MWNIGQLLALTNKTLDNTKLELPCKMFWNANATHWNEAEKNRVSLHLKQSTPTTKPAAQAARRHNRYLEHKTQQAEMKLGRTMWACTWKHGKFWDENKDKPLPEESR